MVAGISCVIIGIYLCVVDSSSKQNKTDWGNENVIIWLKYEILILCDRWILIKNHIKYG